MSLAEKSFIFTYKDFQNWEDDHYRHELVDGEHFMTPSPNVYHQEISGNLFWHLKKYVDEKALGKVFHAPTDVVLSDIDVLVPDLFFVSTEKLNNLREDYIDIAPDLVIEILSPSSVKRDREIKFKRYGYYGVKEYWIVDPEKQLIEVYDLEQAKLIQVVPKNQILNTPTFPDLNLLLGKIF